MIDPATGKTLKFEVVTGAQARTDSPNENFSATGHYIKVHLAHPVPEHGEYQLKWEIISGKQATERKLPITESIRDDSEIVVTHLARPPETGTTNRIRLMETYY